MRRWTSSLFPTPLELLLICQKRLNSDKSGIKERPTRKLHNKKRSLGQRQQSEPSPRRKLSASKSELALSVDLAEERDRLDVEKHFPAAMSHIKTTPVTPYVAEQRKVKDWKRIVNPNGVDGYALPNPDEGIPPSLFDEGSIDIRRGPNQRGRGVTQAASRREILSPDILQLTGGNVKQHGLALSDESNGTPADATIEPEEEERRSVYGDTPVQLTDMLKERLMELKAEKLREDRNDTYMPRRLKLLSDAEVRQRYEKEPSRQMVTERVKQINKGSQTSMADLINAADEDEQGTDALVNTEDISTAARILRKAADLIPGGSSYDPFATHSPGAPQPVRDATSATTAPDGAVHLLRCLPRAGFCSRREALHIIASGQVRVDNIVERNPFRYVKAENDVHVAGHGGRLRFAPPRLWMYHKPAYVVVSRNDVAGRTLFTKHARIIGMDHLVPVGSLPMRAHGLLLLTNDGELSRFMENPSSMIQQTYLLRIRPAIDPVLAHKLNTEGITINGKKYTNIEFFVNPAIKSRYSIKVKVRGEMMPIAQLMQHLGRTVERGGRISFGPFSMRTLPVGSIREATVPPYYIQHAGAVWKEFVERDWPYFRRQRVVRLRQLSRYRELSQKESEELDSFTYEELKDALSLDTQELKTLSDEQAHLYAPRPTLDEHPLPDDFGNVRGNTMLMCDDEIIEDITAVN